MVPDVYIVPLSISYEKILDGNFFVTEQMERFEKLYIVCKFSKAFVFEYLSFHSNSVREKLEFGYVSELGYWYPNSDT